MCCFKLVPLLPYSLSHRYNSNEPIVIVRSLNFLYYLFHYYFNCWYGKECRKSTTIRVWLTNIQMQIKWRIFFYLKALYCKVCQNSVFFSPNWIYMSFFYVHKIRFLRTEFIYASGIVPNYICIRNWRNQNMTRVLLKLTSTFLKSSLTLSQEFLIPYRDF